MGPISPLHTHRNTSSCSVLRWLVHVSAPWLGYNLLKWNSTANSQILLFFIQWFLWCSVIDIIVIGRKNPSNITFSSVLYPSSQGLGPSPSILIPVTVKSITPSWTAMTWFAANWFVSSALSANILHEHFVAACLISSRLVGEEWPSCCLFVFFVHFCFKNEWKVLFWIDVWKGSVPWFPSIFQWPRAKFTLSSCCGGLFKLVIQNGVLDSFPP